MQTTWNLIYSQSYLIFFYIFVFYFISSFLYFRFVL